MRDIEFMYRWGGRGQKKKKKEKRGLDFTLGKIQKVVSETAILY